MYVLLRRSRFPHVPKCLPTSVLHSSVCKYVCMYVENPLAHRGVFTYFTRPHRGPLHIQQTHLAYLGSKVGHNPHLPCLLWVGTRNTRLPLPPLKVPVQVHVLILILYYHVYIPIHVMYLPLHGMNMTLHYYIHTLPPSRPVRPLIPISSTHPPGTPRAYMQS
ncbi:uncharacterized protein F4807DRAFT_411202 [Annulohypoxylon truncatum]|uniref:uncharacterized protein n=1 Tax=Annulohypoxylon truncatum TaxID=327061 RepID=UPI0020082A32|nr:uncharacterized protein F4807DRAFT_411202 [Annulohypoxylon truncatum]KAI1213465.1 hypothetical protein F4807DRAFT_411202 [Annulohypoxylon truncatum]